MKKFIILALFMVTLGVPAESAGKSRQTSAKNTVDKEKMNEDLELADTYYQGSKILKAKDLYEKYSPVSDTAKIKLAGYYTDDFQEEKAAALLEDLARKKNKEALKLLARIYFADNSEDKLIKLFNKNSSSDMKLLAEIYLENDYYEKSTEIYRNLAVNGDEDAYFDLIKQYGYSVSTDLLKIESAKGKTRADKELGDLYKDNYEYKDAVTYYKRYLKTSKGDREIFTAFGEYYSKKDLKKELAPYIKRGDKGAKEVLEEYLAMAEEGNALDSEEEIVSENHEEPADEDISISSETDIIEDDTEFTPAVINSFEENEKLYLDKIAENENDYYSVNELLSLYYMNDKKEELNIFIDKLINDGYYLGNNWKLVKDRAVPIYEEYIAQGINRAKPVLAEIYLENKDMEKALSIYESMLPTKNSSINMNLANLYNKTQKYDKTLSLIQNNNIDLEKDLETADSYSDSSEFHTFMLRYGAYAYYKLQEYEKAKILYSYLADSNYSGYNPFGFLSEEQDDFYYPDKIYLLDIYKKTDAKDEYDELEKKITDNSGIYQGDLTSKQALADYYASNGDFDKAKKLLTNDKTEIQISKTLNLIPLVLGLIPNVDFFENNEKIADMTIKYNNYGEIKKFVDKVLVLTDNSYDNSKNYINSVKIAGIYITKQYSDELGLSESFKKKFLKYSNNTLKKEFKNSYKNLHKNKKGVSFYPGNSDNNFMLSMLLKEWNIDTKTLSGTEDPVITYSRKQIFENGILFFSDKYVKEFSKINDILDQEKMNSYESESDSLLKNTSSKVGDAVDQFFSKTNFSKDYKEFYNLLPSMILLNIRENLEKNKRDDIIKKLDRDYADYLSEDKVKTIERIKESNEELKSKTNIFINPIY